MMKTLIIDTASKNLYVILLDKDTIYKQVVMDSQLTHSVILNQTVGEVLQDAKITLDQVDTFAVNVGVGSFTGIRVAISTVKGYNFALNKKLIEVNSLTTLAYTKQGRVNCLYDAGKGYYFACYDKSTVIIKPTLIKETQAKEYLKEENTVVFDPMVDYSQQIINQVKDKIALKQFSETLTPLYIRVCQAEEERKKNEFCST